MDVVWFDDGTVYNRRQRQHNKIPTLPRCISILPVICIQRTDADADNTSAAAPTPFPPTRCPSQATASSPHQYASYHGLFRVPQKPEIAYC